MKLYIILKPDISHKNIAQMIQFQRLKDIHIAQILAASSEVGF